MKSRAILIPLFSFSLAGSLFAQPSSSAFPIIQVTLGQSAVALSGPWKFHIGDNLEWARPDFDDANWETVDLTPGSTASAGLHQDLRSNIATVYGQVGMVPGWSLRGHENYWGYAWYRARVRATARVGEAIALAAPVEVDNGYELYVNGQKLGGTASFEGAGVWPDTNGNALPASWRLPAPAAGASAPASFVIAFRVWKSPQPLTADNELGGLRSAPVLGGAAAIEAHQQLVDLEIIRENVWHVGEALLFLLLAVIALSLNFFDRTDPVYRWLVVVSLLIAMANSTDPLGWLHLESARTGFLAESVFLNEGIFAAWAMVWWRWFRLRRPAWGPQLIAGFLLLYITATAFYEYLLFHRSAQAAAVFLSVSLGLRVLFFALLILIVAWGIREQGREGWLTLPAIALLGIGQFQGNLRRLPVAFYPFGVRFSLHQVGDLVLIAVLGVLILRRLLQSLEHQRAMALDVNQAREVQRVLIPEELPRVPGWTIESDYRPASEVGGDFFQIIPLAKAGSVLIVLGDVAGKGLQAGMLVALIVGTIRTVADADPDPLKVLEALNRRLCGRGHAHATCLALRVDADGTAALANAGHLPPYLNGKELPIEGAMPLGMHAEADFPVHSFHLEPADRLMLVSDGIAEARNEQGDLFGFDKAQALSTQPASVVAAAAQQFGQQDDISVVSIQRALVAEAIAR
jgi:hypothetical protein